MENQSKIRNVAIIAHVDHGKTTLLDGLLKQSKTFASHQAEMAQSLIMDSGELESERGITITAKTTAIEYKDHRINIIDTPGHADFSGEVERTLGMADGCLLVVDAQEGPMPQTTFVLAKALNLGLKPIVVINKIDKRDARINEVEKEVEQLFLNLAIDDSQLDFKVYYANGRAGRAYTSVPSDPVNAEGDLTPIFEAIINEIPAPNTNAEAPFQMLVSSLSWDSYQGKYAVGRINRGTLKAGVAIVLIDVSGNQSKHKVDKLFISRGLNKVSVAEASAGDIVWVTGIPQVKIGETLADERQPEALPAMEIEPPTLQISIGPNTSPFAGHEGEFTTSRQIGARLKKELETNVSLKVEEQGTKFMVSGRGELHLSVLIETLRREGYELEVGRPEVVTRNNNGQIEEPIEELIIEVPDEHLGAVNSELGRRRAILKSMEPTTKGVNRLIFIVPTRALLGLRSVLLTATKGTAVANSLLIGYEPMGAPIPQLRNGVLISSETGEAVTYSLQTVEERGTALIGPGTKVYMGMIIGLNRRADDMEINVTKEKKLTNVRASATDMAVQLTPYTKLTLEEALDFIEPDELLEVTPKSIRMRKKFLLAHERKRSKNQLSS